MAYERGGRADKFGNIYENRFVVRKLVGLLCEEAVSVTVEPVGPDERGTDLIVQYNDASREFLQCKARNGTSNNITMSWLSSEGILKHIAEHTINIDERYVLITPLSGIFFQDLLKRAANSPDYYNFYNYQLSVELKNKFHALLEKWGLGKNEYGIQTAYTRLSRTRMEQIPDDCGFVSQTKALIGCHVTGDPEDVYNLLNAFPCKDYYGKAITAPILWDYLKKYNHTPNQLAEDRRIAPRIQQLNQEFLNDFFPINGNLVETPEVAKIMEAIHDQSNVLLLGKAGSGKSGCLQAFLKTLAKENMPYLAIKLNHYIPTLPTQKWGQKLSLPTSPSYCFESVHRNQTGVLVLDQLDSLRWTSIHVEQAMLACKMILSEIENINSNRDRKIIVVLVSRTFDYQTDPALKSLINKCWKTVEISSWTEETVKNILGESNYCQLLPETVELLKTPNNLAIWQNLDNEVKYTPLRNSYDLMQQWVDQIFKKARLNGLSEQALKSALDAYLESQVNNGVIPKIITQGTQSIAQFLVSENMLRETRKSYYFSHQSIADYLSVTQLIEKVIQGISICELVPERNQQLPQKRIVWQMFWQQLFEVDQKLSLRIGQNFLSLSDAHFYFKCTFWEALGQINNPLDETMQLLKMYWLLDEWKPFLQNTVFRWHPAFIKNFVKYGFGISWDQSPALDLLLEIVPLQETFAIDILESIALQSEEVDKKISYRVYNFLESPSDRCFALGMKILYRYPQSTQPYLPLHKLTRLNPKRKIAFLEYLLDCQDLTSNDHFLLEAKIKDVIPTNTQDKISILEALLPLIIKKTPKEKENDQEYYFWRSTYYEPTLGNHIVQLLAEILSQLSQGNKPYIITFLKTHWSPISFVEQMLVLQCLNALSPVEDAAFVSNWIVENFPQGLFESVSTEKSTLGYAQRLLKNFSPNWTEEKFSHIEQLIMEYHEPNELDLAKNRFIGIRRYGIEYFPYWGMLQEVLLPYMDESKLSVQSRQQIKVLQRRAQIVSGKGHFANNAMRGMAGFVSSKLSKNLEKIKDKTWIEIISDKNNSKFKRSFNDNFEEASPEMFAQSFEQAIKNEPKRFATIIENLPVDIFDVYVCHIFDALRDDAVFSQIKFARIILILEKYIDIEPKKNEANTAIAFCRLIEEHAQENWPQDILQRLYSIALYHPHPAQSEVTVSALDDSKQTSADFLLNNAINCTRGCAFSALGEIAWEHPEHCSELICCFEAGERDQNPAVRYAVANSMGALYNFYAEKICGIFHELLMQDFRLLSVSNHGIYVIHSFKQYEADYHLMLHKAFTCDDTDLQKLAGSMICALHIYNDCTFPELNWEKYTDSQAAGLCEQALYCMQKKDYFLKSLKVLKITVPHCEKVPFILFRKVFFNEEKAVPQIELLDIIFSGVFDSRFINESLESFLSWDLHPNISFPYISKICEYMAAIPSDSYYYEKDLLPKVLLKLLDFENVDSDIVQKCLDLWDKLFQTNVISAPLLLKQMNED